MKFLAASYGDYLVITLAILVVGFSYGYYWQGSILANQAEIRVNGKHWSTVDLFQDQALTVHGSMGDSTIEIKDAKIRFTKSPCPNKLCIHQGWLRHSGEVAACLPNKISVHILGPDPLYDTINF